MTDSIPETDWTEEPAGFWARLLAHVVDNVVLFFVTWLFVFLWIYGASWLGATVPAADTPVFAIVSVVLHWAAAGLYYTFFHARFGTTLGKWPLGIQVVDARTGQRPSWRVSALRSLGYLLSHATLELGFVMVAFRKDRRGLHELVSGTRSIRRA